MSLAGSADLGSTCSLIGARPLSPYSLLGFALYKLSLKLFYAICPILEGSLEFLLSTGWTELYCGLGNLSVI